MSRSLLKRFFTTWCAGLLVGLLASNSVWAQTFEFQQLDKTVREFTVIVEMKVEYSFGMQSNEHEQRLLGTIATEDGLVMFDGSFLSDNNPFAPIGGPGFKSTPTKIEIITFDKRKFEAEYVGMDRRTRIAFARIKTTDGETFRPVKFVTEYVFTVGDWLGLYMLLPEFVEPPLAADVGMISTLVTAPEEFALTVGFSSLELASVLFDEQLNAVGLLGTFTNPSASSDGGGGFMESLNDMQMPLMGVITGDRLEKLIADPPVKGKIDRAWLGITMQALTEDIADFLGIDVPGGIIVNDIVGGSPAEACDLQVGDIIYQVNSQQLEIDREEKLTIFQRQVADMGAGTAVEFAILRPHDDQLDTLKLLATLAAAPLAAADAAEYENESLEFKVRDLVFADFLYYNVEQGSLTGVVIAEMKPGGLAYIGGLQPGDIIQRVDGQTITAVPVFESALEGIEQEKPLEVIFFVWRFNKTMFVNVKTDWE